jgi:large subunit ribosomal protein L31
MKTGIHPAVYLDAKTTCMSCGAVYKIPSIVEEQQVEVCMSCHPVYTGEYRGVVASGRVDRFRKVSEAATKKKAEVNVIEEKRKIKAPRAKKTKSK